MSRIAAGLAMAAALVLLGTGPVAANEPEGWSYELWNELMSPFCPGRSLADCPSDRADSLRMWILVQESAGRAREDVEQELVERYGDSVLSAPRARGFGLTAYAVPIAVFLGGGCVVAVFLRRFTRRAGSGADARGAEAAPPVIAESDRLELERRIDEELSG